MTVKVYRVEGMTCDHCKNAVTQELSALDGVSAVDVSVEAGTATVTSEQELGDDRRFVAIHQLADRFQVAIIVVAAWKEIEQILDCFDAEVFQALGVRGPDAL